MDHFHSIIFHYRANLMKKWLFHAAALLFILLFASTIHAASVRVVTFNGTINPASANYLHTSIIDANAAGAECIIVLLNTPGGLLSSTREIVGDFLSAPLPVIVYVSPSGAQSASAGVFITLAAHYSAMAPGTNIGAAHPVTLEGQMDSIMMQKSTNDAAAFIRTISEKRHRNVAWADSAVRKSVSITETEALNGNIIDTVVSSVPQLLEILQGKEFETSSGKRVLATHGATIQAIEPNLQQKLLDILSNPNVTYILMMLGIWGLIFELYNPGLIFPGIIGFISLVLAFYSFNTLPVNYAGAGLIVFAIILFILEIKIVSHGLLAVGGILSLLIGSLFLFQSNSTLEVVSLSWSVVITTIVCTTVFFLFVIGLGIRAQRRKPTTGMQGLVGEIGEAITSLEPDGEVKVHGEIWQAQSAGGTIPRGSKISVVSMQHLKLTVKQI
jgi:membrane-bound serine protease (ClpP class)